MAGRSKLSQHKFENGKLITPFNQHFQDLLKEQSWYYGRMPEYLWLGLIVNDGDRNIQMEKCLKILNVLHELDEGKEITVPKISLIFNLPGEKQKAFYKLLEELQVIEALKPLSLVFSDQSSEFLTIIKGYTVSIKKRVKVLNEILEDLSNQHSNLTTDVRFLILYKFMISGNLHVQNDSILPEMISRYAFISHEDPVMRLYRPNIRASEMVMSTEFGEEDSTNIEFVKMFWKKLSLLTECEAFYVEIETAINEPIDLKKYKQHVHDILDYYTKIFTETRPLDNRMLVLLGIATYSYKRLIELVDHNLEYTISGRSIMRSILENYMMTKYLLLEEPHHDDIWGEYQDYGIGQYKLIYGRYAEDEPALERSHVPFKYINLLVSEFKNEEFIDIDTSYFGSGNIRTKFKKVNEENLWKYYYDYDSIFEHGLWGAIRESSILKCSAPGHQYHGIPDVDNLQKLPSVAHDCIMIMNKHLKLLEDQYDLPEILQEEKNE
ncbi:hypothetical protein C3744_23675 [Priestia megaterium]|uniref:Uncharacterized protein n=1 Tax=Priestia megaterium TaxID=1404 RepID=A0A3D8WWN2_PRIMG|nr:DUF5677 domain-containing protein [Priestia megaterium]MDH3169452.1 DUF5677 domain-containing protein [Priestia megaterium]RDZ10101.1 hypothetical protein C3744_23675 [Priestia megaterium]